MSTQMFLFDKEGDAIAFASRHGNRATIVYRGDYRHDWLVSLAE